MRKSLLLVAAVLVLGISGYSFDTSVLQISLWAPGAQVIPDDLDISGLKLNLPYGSNHKVVGLDIGFVSRNNDTSAVQVNLGNMAIDRFSGLQAGLVNHSGESNGVSLGLFYNGVESLGSGLAVALVNTSLEFRGVQIGLVNYTEFLTGVQFGLVNIVTESQIPFFPFLNLCF